MDFLAYFYFIFVPILFFRSLAKSCFFLLSFYYMNGSCDMCTISRVCMREKKSEECLLIFWRIFFFCFRCAYMTIYMCKENANTLNSIYIGLMGHGGFFFFFFCVSSLSLLYGSGLFLDRVKIKTNALFICQRAWCNRIQFSLPKQILINFFSSRRNLNDANSFGWWRI